MAAHNDNILAEPMRAKGFAAWVGRTGLRLVGWTQYAPVDLPKHCIIMVYPHTSNWDFPLGLMCKWAAGMEVNYLGKDSLFKSPLGWFFRATGGVPIDRSRAGGFVGQMVLALQSREIARFVIAVEGTRRYTPHLKTGFYRAAVAAQVPLVLSTIDYASKRVALFATIHPTGDEEADLATLRAHYAGVKGRHPAAMAPLVFPPRD